MTDPDEQLRALLGCPPPPAIAALDADTRRDLAELIAQARVQQAQSLKEAFDASLRHVPFPARGIVKRVLLG